MRVFISLMLSLFFYSIIVFFFLLIFNKPKSKKEILIHTAIILPNKTKTLINHKAKVKKSTISKKESIKKTKVAKKIKKGSISAFTKGGDVNFNDIFKNVNYNIDTKKLHKMKQLDMSRFKGIEKNLKKVKLINFDVSYVNTEGSVSNKDIENIIAKKLSPIWDLVSNIAGEYAKINIIFDGNVRVKIIDSNLPQYKQTLLIEKIKKLNFDKNFNITVKFITKVNK
jgi:hypothetical protein